MHFEFAEQNHKLYVCPGETEPISHAVHLGRLARFFPPCRECPLREDTGSRVVPEQVRWKQDVPDPIVSEPGVVRGQYLNQITRETAGHFVSLVARGLWAETHRAARVRRREHIEAWAPPVVVIGYDRRPSSPDIMLGVQECLRLMGCDVIDIGCSGRSTLEYGVKFHGAAGGIFVTGAHCSPAWTGLDILDARGRRCAESLDLPTDAKSVNRARPVRHSGSYRFQPIADEFGLRLRKMFRPSRALRLCIGVEDGTTRRHVEGVLSGADVHFIDLPRRVRNTDDPEDPDVRLVGDAVVRNECDIGAVIDEDHRRCAILDDEGELIPAEAVAALLSGAGRRTLVEDRAIVFPGRSVRCDAAMTVARVATRLSRVNETLAKLTDADARQPVARR